MNHPGRIKIIMKILKECRLGHFLFSIGAIESEMEAHAFGKTISLDKLAAEWKKNPHINLAFTLINNFALNNPQHNFWKFTDEVDWTIEQGFIKPRDILFWGSGYTKKGKKRTETKWTLIRNLDTEHIKNIFAWYEAGRSWQSLAEFKDSKLGSCLDNELKLRENEDYTVLQLSTTDDLQPRAV